MEGKFLLNDSPLAYFIHGQPIRIKYQTEGCWFVVIVYNDGKSLFRIPHFRKANGVFESVTNVYSPKITVWGVGWGIGKLLHRSFNINFFNTRPQVMHANTPELPGMPQMNVKPIRSQILWSRFNFKSTRQPVLVAKEIGIKNYDDHHQFKLQLEPILIQKHQKLNNGK